MLYFAYGSNLDPVQWAGRCPESPCLGVARLDHYRLCFPRPSPIRQCAVASVEPAPGGAVWGALYRMSPEDLAFLDAREGHFPDRPKESRYGRVGVTVSTDNVVVDAVTYVAVPAPDPGLPSPTYVRHLVDGAVHHAFPAAYVAMLRAVPVSAEARCPGC